MNLPVATQRRILARRYLDILVADWPTVVLLVLQAPFIGWLCTLVWGSVETDTPSLYFVLVLAAMWFGCIDGCREIVRERAILERERLFGLSLIAYVGSKVQVLSAVVLVQVILLQGAVEWTLALRGPLLLQTLALWMAGMCGLGLGLVASALARSQALAVSVLPLIILPQILFSEFTIPREAFGSTMRWLERLMPISWSFDVFRELAALQTSWLAVLADFGVLLVMAACTWLVSVLALSWTREV